MSSAPPQHLPPPAWGAIAYSPSTRRFGWVSQQITQSHAENGAVDACGPGAVVAVSGFNMWIALAVDDSGAYGSGWGDGRQGVEERALYECAQRTAGRCNLAVSFHTTSKADPADVVKLPSEGAPTATEIEPADQPGPVLVQLPSRVGLHSVAMLLAELPSRPSPKPDHAPEWLRLGAASEQPISSLGPVVALLLPDARRERLLGQAISPGAAPRAYLHRGALPAVATEGEFIHLDLTGECKSHQHRHVVWDPSSPDLVQAAFFAQTIADIDADPESLWRPPIDPAKAPNLQGSGVINLSSFETAIGLTAALWTETRGPFDPASIETLCRMRLGAIAAACKERVAQTGKGTYASESIDGILSKIPGLVDAPLGGSLQTVAEFARAAARIASERLDLDSWLCSNAPLVITLPPQPSAEELDVINALLGCAHFLGLNGAATQAPIVVWDLAGGLGDATARHGAYMEHGPRWLVCTDDLSAFFNWSALLDSQVLEPKCDLLIGAASYQALLDTQKLPLPPLDLKQPFDEQAVLLRGDEAVLLDD